MLVSFFAFEQRNVTLLNLFYKDKPFDFLIIKQFLLNNPMISQKKNDFMSLSADEQKNLFDSASQSQSKSIGQRNNQVIHFLSTIVSNYVSFSLTFVLFTAMIIIYFQILAPTAIDWQKFIKDPQKVQGPRLKWRVEQKINSNQVQFAKNLKNLTDYSLDDQKSGMIDIQRRYYESKYKISKYNEKPFCIVIPTFNNIKENRHIKNLRSILMQDYKNYHIVIIDDASTDGTGTQIKQYLQHNQTIVPANRYTFIRNQKQRFTLPNLRNAAMNHCQAHDIFLIVDGDDSLLGKQVLKLINSIFQARSLWFMYTNFLTIKDGVGYSSEYPQQVIKENTYRNAKSAPSHLRVFYTLLFRNIKQEDLMDDNKEYFRASNDLSICLPILQQAHQRVAYLPELTYYYNQNTGMNNHLVRLEEQRKNEKIIRSRKSYQELSQLIFDSRNR